MPSSFSVTQLTDRLTEAEKEHFHGNHVLKRKIWKSLLVTAPYVTNLARYFSGIHGNHNKVTYEIPYLFSNFTELEIQIVYFYKSEGMSDWLLQNIFAGMSDTK